VKTASSKSSGHKAKKSSGGGLVNSFLGFCSKRLNQAKKAIKKAYKKVCTTAHRAKKFVVNTAKNVTKKAVSVVKSAGKAFVKFKQKHPILTGALIIGAAGVLTLATGGATSGLLGAACAGAFTGSVIGASAGATINFASTLYHGGSLKDALGSAAQGFGSGAASGAISGFITGGAAGLAAVENPSVIVKFAEKVAGSKPGQWAINTVAETAGNLGDRALSGEKITAGDAAFSFVINAAFNFGGPKVFNKVKNSKLGQAVSGKLSNVKDVIKGKVGSAVSAAKGKVAGALSSFNKGESKLPMEYNLQYFASKDGSVVSHANGNSGVSSGEGKPLFDYNLQFFADKSKSEYHKDVNGRWHRPNGQFASNAEMGIKTPLKTPIGTHGNSLSDPRTNYGYALVDKDTNEILKFGETLHPDSRYSKKFLEENNAKMKIMDQGSKRYIHDWQHDLNMYYKYKYGEFPKLNERGW